MAIIVFVTPINNKCWIFLNRNPVLLPSLVPNNYRQTLEIEVALTTDKYTKKKSR